jgi:hypothetical protein
VCTLSYLRAVDLSKMYKYKYASFLLGTLLEILERGSAWHQCGGMRVTDWLED